MVRGRKLLWYWVLLVRKVAGIPCVCDLVVIVIGWFIILLYNSDSEEWCSSLARMRIKSLNRWSLLLLCSGISPSLVLGSSTPSLPLMPAINRTAWSWSCSMSDMSFLLLGSQAEAAYSRWGRQSLVSKQFGNGRSPVMLSWLYRVAGSQWWAFSEYYEQWTSHLTELFIIYVLPLLF